MIPTSSWDKSLLLLVFAMGLAACEKATTETEESTESEPVTVFFGGTVLTVDDAFTVAESIAVQGERILAVGDHDDVMASAGNDAEVIDISGKTLLPGFIDAHTHPVGGGASSVFENVGIDRFRSVEEALDRMEEAAMEAGDWLLFVNLDLATQSFAGSELTTQHLDVVSDSVPVVVWHAGGHKMTVNSAMLERIGVSAETEDPAGSKYGRFEDGAPNGNISGSTALMATLGKTDPYMGYDRVSGTISLGQDWVTKGLTTIGVAGVNSPADWEVLSSLGRRAEDFPIRTRNYLQWAALEQWDEIGLKPGDGDAKTRVVGWKISADGSNQAFTGLQREPYLNRDTTGLAYMRQEDINAAVVEGTARGGQMAMHGNGDAGIDSIIAAVEKARAEGIDVVRPRIEHCSIVQDDQVESLKRNEISCSFLIAHVLYWGEAFRDSVFGADKAEKLDRAGSFERAGIPYSLHSDFSVSVLSPLEMVEAAVTRNLFTEPGQVLAPNERATIEGALRGVTSVPAWQLMSEHEIGSLEAGKLADFVVLAADPREVEPGSLAEIDILETWINGNKVH